MEKELVNLTMNVYRLLLMLGVLGGILRLAYNYLQQISGVAGKEEAFTEGIRSVVAATILVILIPSLLWLIIQATGLISFGKTLEQVVEALGKAAGL